MPRNLEGVYLELIPMGKVIRLYCYNFVLAARHFGLTVTVSALKNFARHVVYGTTLQLNILISINIYLRSSPELINYKSIPS